MSENLNITNPDSLIYRNELIQLTVLGGIKLDGLDRMRATLKAELPENPKPPLRHNLDLYNDTQVEKYIRKAAEKLEIGTSVIAASINELTTQLENYRLQHKEQETENELHKIAPMTHAQIQAAKKYLSSPDLMQRTAKLLNQSGIIGEEINAQILYLTMTCLLYTSPSPRDA